MMYMRCGNRGKPCFIFLEVVLNPFNYDSYATIISFFEEVDNNWKDLKHCSQYVG